MKIDRLKLTNFRNYNNVNITFNKNLNIIIGNNAQGKTNILESIVILAITKSHRLGVNNNVVMIGKKRCKISGKIKKDRIISKLDIVQNEDKKELFLNSTKISKISKYISNLNIIVFTPDDLEIIKGSPNIRRNLLNIQLSQMSSLYLNTYNEYNKILKTRNEYLKILYNNGIADKKYLDILTDKLVEKAVIIYKMRNTYISNINKNINNYYNSIGDKNNIYIKYLPNVDFVDFVDFDDNNIKNKLLKKINRNYNKELKYGMSLYGPHRDDFVFYLDEMDLKFYGSQGQQKIAVLAFKLSEIDIFKDITGFKPVLLFDDIFSELDLRKRNKLLKFIKLINIQCIITTPDIKNLNKKNIEDSYIYEVKNGCLERKL